MTYMYFAHSTYFTVETVPTALSREESLKLVRVRSSVLVVYWYCSLLRIVLYCTVAEFREPMQLFWLVVFKHPITDHVAG